MITLKRSYVILLIGTGILVVGSIVTGINSSVLATDFMTNNLVIKKEIISPNEQHVTEIISNEGGTVSVLIRGQPFNNQIQASVLDNKDAVIWKDTFNGDFISNFEAKKGVTYQIVIKNPDKKDVTVDAIIGNVPFLGIDHNSKEGNVAGVLAGLGLGIVGFLILIVGGVLFFVDRRPKKLVTTN